MLCLMPRQQALQVAADDAAKPKIEGYFYLFNTLSEPIWDMYKWELAPGCGAKSLAEHRDQKVLFDHDSKYVFGSVDGGTASIREDEKGCFGSADPVDAEWANGVIKSIRRRDITAASFGFYILTSHWRQQDGWDIEVLDEVDMIEGSVVTFPRFRSTLGQIKAGMPREISDPTLVTRALNRVHQKLDVTDDDLHALRHYGSLLVASSHIPRDYKESLAKVISPPAIVIPTETWVEEVKNLALGG